MNRRGFLLSGAGIGGTLVLGWAVTPPAQRLLPEGASLVREAGEVQLNGWLTINATGLVSVAVPRSEMGQGIYTALPQLLAEELGCAWNQVQAVQAPIDQIYANVEVLLGGLPLHPDDRGVARDGAQWIVRKLGRQVMPMLTGGSTSVMDAWHIMRVASASARLMLIDAAAERFRVAPSTCTVKDGWVMHPSGLRASFGELAAQAAKRTPSHTPPLKALSEFSVIGKSLPRTDMEAKVTGTAQFGADVRLPGMLYASLRMAPVTGGTWRAAAAGVAEQMPGVKAVVPLGNKIAGASEAIAVIAAQWWQAESALKAIEKTLRFDGGTLDSAAMDAGFKAALDSGRADTFHSRGKVADGFAQAKLTHEAEYRAPFLAHATLEPQTCTALVRDGAVEVWVPTQSPTMAQWIAAKAAGVKRAAVTVHTTFLGGGFGRRSELDLVAQAVELALTQPGVPVQLIWPRKEDMTHDFFRPAAVARMRGGLDGAKLIAYEHRGVSGSILNSLAARVGMVFMGLDTPMQKITKALKTTGQPDKTSAEGASDRPYEIPHQRIEHVTVKSAVPLGFWRSVGHSQNAFFSEAFMDELAAKAGQDPLAFRRALLANHPRHLAVLNLAAEKAGWGTPLPEGRARGIALHESFGSIVAEVAEVSIVKSDSGSRPRVHRVVCAIDCGIAINPAIIARQMESSVVFGLSAALYGEITFKAGMAEQKNFGDYKLLSLAECPVIDTHIVSSSEPPGGVGEPGVPPIAPALANALFKLTSKPVRSLPIRL